VSRSENPVIIPTRSPSIGNGTGRPRPGAERVGHLIDELEVGGVQTHLLFEAMPWICISIFAGFYAIHLSSVHVLSYNEGSYLWASKLFVEGKRPYVDFFHAQPPGLIWFCSVAERFGLGLLGERLLWQSFVVATAVSTYMLARRISGGSLRVAPLAVLILVSSPLFILNSNLITNGGPAWSLATASFLFAAFSNWKSLILSAFLLALASLFRIQSLSFIPAIILMILSRHGLRDGMARAVAWTSVVALVVLFLMLAVYLSFPSCLEGMVFYQMKRPRLGLRGRLLLFREIMQRPEFLAGFASATFLITRSDRFFRGLGWSTLAMTAITTLAANSLYLDYYLMALPLYAVCTAVLLSEIASRSRWPWSTAIGLLVVFGTQFPEDLIQAVQTSRTDRVNREFLERLQRSEARTILAADPGIALAAGKRVPDDLYSIEPAASRDLGLYNDWILRVYPEADAIVVTVPLLKGLSPKVVDLFRRGGKPIYFPSETDRRSWTAAVRESDRDEPFE
jgi:hypothetical protein